MDEDVLEYIVTERIVQTYYVVESFLRIWKEMSNYTKAYELTKAAKFVLWNASNTECPYLEV